jgi:glycosyltransferase involved in cell wall biosynthesis
MADATSLRHAFVIPAYGDSPFLPDCLDSIRGQTRGSSEVLITSSTPSAYVENVAQRYRVPLIVNPRRANIGSDWNFALTASTADYVTLAHQDDTYGPDYLARMVEPIRRTSDLSIAFCDYLETSPKGPRPLHLNIRIKRFLTRRAFGRHDIIRDEASKRRMLAWGNPVCCPSVVLNRAALADFRFTEDLHSNLDWEAWRQLAGRPGAFVYVREPLVNRRIHTESETSALIADKRRLEEDRTMFERFWPAPIAALIMTVYRTSYLANRS